MIQIDFSFDEIINVFGKGQGIIFSTDTSNRLKKIVVLMELPSDNVYYRPTLLSAVSNRFNMPITETIGIDINGRLFKRLKD